MSKFKRYERYKDSWVEWIGEIPEHWEVSKIKFTTYVKGRIGWQGLRADEFIDEGPYLVTGTDFIDGLVNWDSCYHISMERYNEAPPIQLRENDLLITKDGTIGKVAIVKNKPKYAILNSGIFVTRPQNSAYLTEFMYWILNSQVFNRFIEYMSLGSTIVHLYQQTFENFSFPITNLNEQKTIVDFLNKKTSEIDDLIADKEKLIELLQEKRQAIITEVVTKGLNPNVRMKDSGIEWIGEIPEHWQVKPIKYLVKAIQTGTTPTTKNDDYFDGEIQWFTPGDFLGNKELYESNRKISSMAIMDNEARLFPEKTVMIVGIGATVGKVAKLGIEGSFNQQITGIIVDEQKLNSDYLYYWLDINNEIIKKISNYTTLPIINNEFIKNFECLSPSILEQQEIINFLNKKTAEIDDLVLKIKEQIEKLKEYRQSLISEAVTGKIDVRDYKDN